MAEVYKKTKKYHPIRVAALDKSDNIIALIQAVIIKETNNFMSGFTARSIISGGPLYTDKNAVDELVKTYDEIVKKKK